MTTHAPFVHLRVHSAYSLSEGAIKLDKLTDLCISEEMPAVAITDNGNLFGSLEFSNLCKEQGIQPIIGAVLTIQEESTNAFAESKEGTLVLLAKNATGYLNLTKLVSLSFLQKTDAANPGVTLETLCQHAEGIIVLTGGPEGLLGKALLEEQKDYADTMLKTLHNSFGDRLYIELVRHGTEQEKLTENSFIELAYTHNIPLVATNDVYFSDQDQYEAHDVLICIADGRYRSEQDRRKFTKEHYFKSAKEMVELFADIPEAIENTLVIAKRCAVMSEEREPLLPNFSTHEGRDEEEELKIVAKEGLEERLKDQVFTDQMTEDEKQEIATPYQERLAFELSVISRMKYPGYFLIVSDFIRWSKDHDIPVGPGRGSGAGSVVAWALRITDLDPLRFGLLFERFLNPERVSMPDFDIDFCQYRRDEVIEYVRQKYGSERVAQIITFGKLQARAVLRDVGRVLEMPYNQVNQICKMIPFNPLEPITLSQAIEMDPQLQKERDSDEQVKYLLDIGLKLEGLYRHASTHAAGVVIGDRPLEELLPLYSDQKSDIPVTQYSMKYAEKAGLVKFDFLGLKTLTSIAETCKLIKKRGIEIDIDHIPFDDPATYQMLGEGDTTGVFQMESAGMRDALRKMKPDSIEDIIALISLYRPGPMENIPTYIARKHGKEEPDYLHPKLEDVLKETFGVIIYQEQVMQIAQILAGYSLGGADLLRRAMGKKIKKEMDAQRDMFVQGAVKNEVDKKQASSIFDLVAKFAGYGFNKSHAAAYAVIGYQTAYLKANYPVEFFTACMNIDIGDTDKINIFKEAVRKSDITILPPDINHSQALFAPEMIDQETQAIRYGLGALKNVGCAAMEELAEERNKHGSFKDIFALARRCSNKVIHKRQLESLAKAGALDDMSFNRHMLSENATLLTQYNQRIIEERESNQTSLFNADTSEEALPVLQKVETWDKNETLEHEFEAIGFYLTAHPLDDYQAVLETIGIHPIAKLDQVLSQNEASIKIAGIVTNTTHRATGTKRFAYLQVSDPSGQVEISVFDSDLISEKRELLENKTPVLITANARKDEGGIRITAESLIALDRYLEHKAHHLTITLEHVQALQEIAALLKSPEKARMVVYLIITTPDNMSVKIALPGRYHVDTDITEKLSSVNGVSHIEERML